MKRVTILCLLIIAILSSSSCSFLSPSTATGSLSGLIIWQTKGAGNVVVVGVNVNVWSWQDGKPVKIASSLSDGVGQYIINNIPSGSYAVTCHQDAPEVGMQIVEKNWVFQDVKIVSGQATQLNLTIDNALPSNMVLPAEYRY